MGRASFITVLGRRPRSHSSVNSFITSESAVSPGRGVSATAAFTNGGEPGGQSTGAVGQSEDLRMGVAENFCNLSKACRISAAESPRLEPRAISAVVGDEFTRFILKSFPPRPVRRATHPPRTPDESRADASVCWPVTRRAAAAGASAAHHRPAPGKRAQACASATP